MADPEFREEYARADDEFALIEALVRARTAAKLTQTELAQRLGTTQSAVRTAGGRQGVALSCHLAPLCRGDRYAVDGGPGADRPRQIRVDAGADTLAAGHAARRKMRCGEGSAVAAAGWRCRPRLPEW